MKLGPETDQLRHPQNLLRTLQAERGTSAAQEGSEGFPWYICEIGQPPPLTPNKNSNLEKWALQSVVRDVLRGERVRDCLRVPFASTVDLWRHQANQRAHYKGLVTCGSVWICPVCASKIAERRRVDLAAAIDRAAVLDLVPYLLTLTVRHHDHETLEQLLEKFSQARGLMRNRKPWKSWVQRVNLAGSVRALEVTHGANGWHVHTHEILFCRSGELRPADVLPMWQSACDSAGLQRPDDHGVDIQTGDEKIGEYVSKWGMDAELTRGMIKRGREGNRSPWDFLRSFFNDGDENDADLFRAYAKQFKGKRQLVWSEGLRELLGLDAEKSDQELAEEIEKGSELLGSLSLKQWRVVVQCNKRGELLHLAAQNNIELVRAYISHLERLQ